jgi:hypothetical protein
MMNRNALIAAAAFAALAVSGSARADETRPSAFAPSLALSQGQAAMLETAPARAPLMELLNKAGVAKPLEDAGITIGGRIEGSFTYSASSPPGNIITGRVFDFEHEDLTLNQVGIVVNKDVDVSKFDIGGRMEWIWGADSRLIHSLGLMDNYGPTDGPDNQWDLNQLYIDVAFGGGFSVRAGKFVTPIGYEVIDPTQNQFYSHSFMFGFAIPFTHTGVLASYKQSDALTFSAGFTRGWDTSVRDNNGTIDFLGGAAYSLPDGKTKLTVNLITGTDQPGDNENWRTLVDVIVSTKVGDNLTLAFNADYAYEANSRSTLDGSDAQWWGVAAYASLAVNNMVAVNGRVEYFNDQDGARLTGAVGGSALYEATIGLAITPLPNDAYGKGLTIRPEVRFDYADKRFFDGGTDHYQLTAAIDAVYKF